MTDTMSERLTDEELDELENWGTSPDPSTTRLVVKEIRALRARVAKLESALKPFVSDGPISQFLYVLFKEDALAALKDTPQ